MAFQDGRGGHRVEPRFETQDDPGGGFRPEADEPVSNLPSKLLGALVALAAVVGFVGIAWYATTQGQKDSSTVVPIIRADISPIKELPAKPGGMKVPNQDKLIFMQITPGQRKPKVERLLPPPEQPMAKPAPPPKSAKTPPSGPLVPEFGALASRTVSQPPKPTQAAAKALPEVPLVKPKPVKPATKPVKPVPKIKNTPKVELASKAPAAPARGAFQVQLGAVKSKTGAQKEVRRLTRIHKSVLAGLTVKALRANLGRRGIFYRLRAGPLAGRTAAAALCAKLKALKQGCIVIEP